MDKNILISLFLVLLLVDSICGISGGETLNSESNYTFLVAIHNYRNDYICTGTILSSTSMVTSASCLGYYPNFNDPAALTDMMALFARQTNYDRRNRANMQQIVSLVKHGKWIPERPDYDCAVVKVKAFEKDVTPVQLMQEKDLIFAGNPVRILGWGAKRENFPNEYYLREGNSLIISLEDCTAKYPDEHLSVDNFFCTHTRGVGACAGDDGGPVLAAKTGEVVYALVGIIGYRKGCGYLDYPDIHTNIYSVIDFIKEHSRLTQFGQIF